MKNLIIVCVAVVAMLGCGAEDSAVRTDAAARPEKWAAPMTCAGVPNLHKVSDKLYRSAQPTAEGMTNLVALGVKTVVNLRDNHSDSDEIGGLPLKARRIEIFTGNMKDKYVTEFLSVLDDTNAVPVLVHCQHGADRTGTMCAMYRILRQGWTADDAIDEMKNGGYGYHSVWGNLPRFIRKSAERLKAQAQKTKCANVQLSNIQYQYPIFSRNGWMEPEFLDFMIPEFATKADMSIDSVLASLEQTMNLSFGTGMVDNRFVEIQYITTIDDLMPLPKMTWTYATVRTILADIAKADRLQPRCYWNPTYRRITFLGPLEWLSEEQEQWRDLIAEAGYPVNLEKSAGNKAE